jgi:1-acyl-sn-glycerol-3-phosphate acyltransferase
VSAVQWLRSLVFIVQMYVMMAIMAVFFTPWAIVDRRGAFAGVHAFCRYVRWTASWMIGLKSEVRGKVPSGEVLIASKHQSFFDIIMICSMVPRPKFIMKKQLLWAPIVGWYALRIGCVAVDRGKRGKAIAQMLEDVASGRSGPGQLIIYPQGTRVAPGVDRPYKIGTGALYRQLDQACVPAATNVGVFWPRAGFWRKPGLAVVEFLPEIAPGRDIDDFMAHLQDVVETRSDQLMRDAGFVVQKV